MDILKKIVYGIRQVLLFSFIPFVWWFIIYRKEYIFTRWIGLYKPELQVSYKSVILFIFLYLLFYMLPNFLNIEKLLGDEYNRIENHESVMNSNLKGININVIATIFVQSFINQALSEEILFRGFLYGRLANMLNDNLAILVQAIIFGLLHNLLFSNITKNRNYHILLFFVGGIGGLLFGILNNIVFNGSIIPSIIVHGLGNFISGLIKVSRK